MEIFYPHAICAPHCGIHSMEFTLWNPQFVLKTANYQSAVKLLTALGTSHWVNEQSIHKWIEHLELLFLECLWFAGTGLWRALKARGKRF